MKKNIAALLILLFSHIAGFSQSWPCSESFYVDDLFASVKVSTLDYASYIDHNDEAKTLGLDFYYPEEDEIDVHPLVILMHGGSFVSGDKSDLATYATSFAKKGYVVASLQYRLWPLADKGTPDSLELAMQVYKTMIDMNSAIDFIKGGCNGGCPIAVDTSSIIIGGASAGAISTLHYAFVDQDDEFGPFFSQVVSAQDGFFKSDENANKVSMVLNFSGAIFDTTWLSNNNIPVISYHGTADKVVPFERDLANNAITLNGSKLIHEQLDKTGTKNLLRAVQNGGHTDIYFSPVFFGDFLFFTRDLTAFAKDIVCSPTPVTKSQQTAISVYPNPASSAITIEAGIENQFEKVQVYSIQGQLQQTMRLNGLKTTLPVYELQEGTYILRLVGKHETRTAKMVIAH